MSLHGVQFSVFTKPWRQLLPELGAMVRAWGFDGIELPVRPGYQVAPERVVEELPKAVTTLRDCGLKIFSVAAPGGPLSEGLIAACGAAGVPVIRIMAPVESDGYLASEARMRREIDRVLPWLQQYGVKLGVQNHCGAMVCNAGGLRSLLAPYDNRYVGAVWDAAHNALSGEEPEMALDIVWSHLCMVNLKNAFWRRVNGPEAEVAEWRPWWTSGPQGMASWPRVAAELKRRGYAGTVCLTAEYSDESAVNRLVAQDLAFAQHLFEWGA
jgi:sugar phosphate isomerase/epimerase